MGKDLCSGSASAREIFQRADAALGWDLSSICFEGPAERLTMTEVTQPAILTTSVAYFEEFFRVESRSETVCAAAGHSLGEYSALVAAGSLAFEDAVCLVHKRGKFMQNAVAAGTGKMVAVLGKETAEIEAALSRVTAGVAEIANINSPGQVVVAGDVAGVNAFMTEMAGAKMTELIVSAPFHCSLMKPAEDALRKELASVKISPPKFPIYANVTAALTTDPEVIRENLAAQVSGRVRWVECIENAIAEQSPNAAYEFGAGNVLTGLMKRINGTIARTSVNSPEELARLQPTSSAA